MRIIIKFTENTTLVPIDNQKYINGYIHKCLGVNNEYHDNKSNYCISKLCGGVFNAQNRTLDFKEKQGFIVVTSSDNEFLNTLITGILTNPDFNWGMKLKTFDFVSENFIGEDIKVKKQNNVWHHFSTLSPFIIKKRIDDKKYMFSTFLDDDFVEVVKEHTIKKLKAVYGDDLNLTDFEVKIKPNPNLKIKKVLIKNVINKANDCQISFFCKADVAKKIYELGVGQSTGSGFGTIYKTENHGKYRF
jgi:CRISPR-associated endoribonuclease Cas6